jgi:hypothetical protein
LVTNGVLHPPPPPSLIADLIAEAELRSATFKALLAALASTNGIVHVESGRCGHSARACLQIWMLAAGGNRYLRVLVDRQRADSDVDLMGSIGHELQHAIKTLSDNHRFETTAAINVGTAIRDELRWQEPLARSR